jgi:predicted transcriptional regulator
MSTLARLHAKGLASREPRGRAFAYRPAPGAALDMASQMESLLGEGPSRTLVLSEFVSALRPDDAAVLRTLLADPSPTGETPA